MARLKDLAAAPALDEFRSLPGRCHELAGDREGRLALDIDGGRRLLLKPSQNPAPRKVDGGLDWRQVDAIEVTEIVAYHD